MKKPRNTPSRRKSGGGTLFGLFIGLVIGVVCAAGVVWYINKAPTPFTSKAAAPAPALPAATGKTEGTPPAPAALPGKPGDAAPNASDKPRFDFYKILPGAAEPTPQAKPAESKPADADKGKADLLKEPAFLQAGSFQNSGDADNQKAKLAMMGVEATVQQVMVQDKVWYRVRLGPFTKMDDLNRMRAELAKQGVEAAVVKKD
ncbi:SPOR domain-containing protein [Rhodocyclus tenuis]|uniref:Cell division protein FtsN n=1 Tax=Rhodocyclus tenuis TaxID=1066 RepID=A0A840G583_RHOTE|nr:SPOR domain-containing protein [Rhodocyclus tenuis]MBB4246491.1 cell division protein FtsN [Rhodocyclus tenuis]